MKGSVEGAEKDNQLPGINISFPWGIPGLQDNEYTFSFLSDDAPFFFLQSVRQPEVGLLLIDPFLAFKDYEFDLLDDVAGQLKITDEKQVSVFCAVNTSRGIDFATVNLLAPIVINTEHFLGKQVVLNDKKYSLRAPLVISRAVKEEGSQDAGAGA
ncbi:MAG: flagellar assembly protein FliW [Firmicutes bacterium]|nr:flagellar assembly protein FliW [Bacillota bacterium]